MKIIYTMQPQNEPERFETDRLIIRHFKPEDWHDLLEIAISKESSEYADCDHPWPTDEKGIQAACNWFVKEKLIWAVEIKSLSKVVCFVNFNGINKSGDMDIGHVMNGKYTGNDYEYESLAVLYDYCFKTQSPAAIIAGWPMGDREKLESLEKLGMKITSTGMGEAMQPGKDGIKRKIEGCRACIKKEDWEKANSVCYKPGN